MLETIAEKDLPSSSVHGEYLAYSLRVLGDSVNSQKMSSVIKERDLTLSKTIATETQTNHRQVCRDRVA